VAGGDEHVVVGREAADQRTAVNGLRPCTQAQIVDARRVQAWHESSPAVQEPWTDPGSGLVGHERRADHAHPAGRDEARDGAKAAASVADGHVRPESMVGTISERGLLDRVFRDPGVVERTVGEVMDPPLPTVEVGSSLEEAFAILSAGAPALVAVASGEPVGVVTRLDLLEHLLHRRG
jgi:CBS domain-containing protein